LTDNSREVQLDALRSLDALILKQGQSICKELYRKNIFTLLDSIVAQVYKEQNSSAPPSSQLHVAAKQKLSLLDILYTVLNRIWYVLYAQI